MGGTHTQDARNGKADARGGKWDEGEFYETGRTEVAEVLQAAFRKFPDMGRESALDFGCGMGRLSYPLAEHFATVVGVDIAAPMIELAVAKNPSGDRCKFILNQRSDLAVIDDDSVDFILSLIVLQHIPQDLIRGYLSEFYRVLRPGGGAVFTLPSSTRLTLRGVAHRVLPHALVKTLKRRRDGAVMDMNAIGYEEAVRFLLRLGFVLESLEPSDSPGPNWYGFRYFISKPLK